MNCPPKLPPVSLFSAIIIVIANMIGTGVFTTLGFQVASLPSPFAVLLLWVVGGIGAFCGALCYGELGAMIPRSGGEYTYLSRIYHPAVGFLSGWFSIVAGFAAPAALAAIALGEYTGAVFPGVDKSAVAVSAIVLLSAVHMIDVKFGCNFQNFFTVGKIILILGIIVCGFFASHAQNLALAPTGRDLQMVFSPAFAVSLVYVSYAYSGWNASVYVAGEIVQPERNLPVSLFLGTFLVAGCYLLLNYVFLHTVPLGELANKIDIGHLSARAILGKSGGDFMTLLICLALISSLSSLVMVGPRVTQTMSEDLGIFRILASTNKRGAPVYAILFQSAVAILLTVTSTFNAVLTYTGFTMALFASMAVLGVVILRWREPERPRPFKTWGYPFTPAIFLLFNGWMLCYLFIERPLPSICGILTVGSGLLVYQLLKKAQARIGSGK